MDKAKVLDCDLDLLNFANKELDENDSVFYIRTRSNNEKLDIIDIVFGDKYDLVEGIINKAEAKEIIMLAAAFHINNGEKIDEYLKLMK